MTGRHDNLPIHLFTLTKDALIIKAGIYMKLKEIRDTLAVKIRKLRNAKNWTQERLAEAIDVHATYISRIESCKKLPSLDIVTRIAEAFGVEVHELLLKEVEMDTSNYQKRKIIKILNESKPPKIEIYSRILSALDIIT
jgi:transcriptional regulator with XRE-family HTH domain